MDAADIEATLSTAERALEEGERLKGTGFWRAVGVVRSDRSLAVRFADRVASIDRRAFEAGVRLRVPLALGIGILCAASAFGVAAIVVARVTADACVAGDPLYDLCWWGGRAFVPVAFLVGFAAVLIGTHSLTHWIVGRALGIRFTHVFLGGPPPPRPGLKTDYATYLRASPAKRAVMHASGAILTKAIPFALLPLSLDLYDEWPWLTWILVGVGVVQIATDAVFFTTTSEWKKVLRELRASRRWA